MTIPTPRGIELIYKKESPSTNEEAKNAPMGASADRIYIAERQSAGRGRLGRSFSSGSGGLYMTMRFEVPTSPNDATKITVLAAVAVARAIEQLVPIKTGIKWVNDIFVCDKKVSGILAEGVLGTDGKIALSVLGIGVNISNALPPELSEIAATLASFTDRAPDVADLAGEIVKEVYALAQVPFGEIIEEYRARSVLIGKTVSVIKKCADEYSARVLGISDAGELILELDGGKRELLATGEVSVRMKQ